jgi:hypothetical protein
MILQKKNPSAITFSGILGGTLKGILGELISSESNPAPRGGGENRVSPKAFNEYRLSSVASTRAIERMFARIS